MLESMFKFLNLSWLTNNLLSTGIIVCLIALVSFFLWNRVSKMQKEIDLLKAGQSTLRRQLAHGVVLDENQVDLSYKTRNSDAASAISDETPNLDLEPEATARLYATQHMPNPHLNTAQSEPETEVEPELAPAPQVPTPALPENNELEPELADMKKIQDTKIVNLKPNIDTLSDVSDLSTVSSLEAEDGEDITFNDLDEQFDDLESELDEPLPEPEDKPLPEPETQPSLSNMILEDMKNLEDEMADEIANANNDEADDDTDDDTDDGDEADEVDDEADDEADEADDEADDEVDDEANGEADEADEADDDHTEPAPAIVRKSPIVIKPLDLAKKTKKKMSFNLPLKKLAPSIVAK